MRLLLREIFRDAISRARQVGIWEKMTNEQKEALVSRYLLLHYNNSGKQERDKAIRSQDKVPVGAATTL